MPAKIIQANAKPFNQVAVDPVTLDIIENALRNARIEMDATLVRTAMSPGIREQGDAFPLIADHQGEMIVGQFGSYIGPFLDGYDGTVEDGDLIFLSDPYSVQGAISHCNDWLVLLPVFKDGRLIAYTSMFGHQSDIGGHCACNPNTSTLAGTRRASITRLVRLSLVPRTSPAPSQRLTQRQDGCPAGPLCCSHP